MNIYAFLAITTTSCYQVLSEMVAQREWEVERTKYQRRFLC